MNSRSNHGPIQIALDGPSASGKSTVGAMLAERWGYDFLDTGMMYRAITLLALQNSISIDDGYALGRLAAATDFAVLHREEFSWRLLANDTDITDDLYTDEINRHVSPISAVTEVRRALVRKQRAIAAKRPIVMAGRDIGTVVLADAPVKIYLEATAKTRATRRTRDASGNAEGRHYKEILESIKMRDEIDSNREDSPLRPAGDAFIIATDGLNLDDVVKRIEEIISAAPVGAVKHEVVEETVS